MAQSQPWNRGLCVLPNKPEIQMTEYVAVKPFYPVLLCIGWITDHYENQPYPLLNHLETTQPWMLLPFNTGFLRNEKKWQTFLENECKRGISKLFMVCHFKICLKITFVKWTQVTLLGAGTGEDSPDAHLISPSRGQPLAHSPSRGPHRERREKMERQSWGGTQSINLYLKSAAY